MKKLSGAARERSNRGGGVGVVGGYPPSNGVEIFCFLEENCGLCCIPESYSTHAHPVIKHHYKIEENEMKLHKHNSSITTKTKQRGL